LRRSWRPWGASAKIISKREIRYYAGRFAMKVLKTIEWLLFDLILVAFMLAIGAGIVGGMWFLIDMIKG
jgi:hypothetical protein